MQDFSQSQLMDQGSIHNSGIDIPKRKDKEDLTESSEVAPFSFTVKYLWHLMLLNLYSLCIHVTLVIYSQKIATVA